MTMTPADLARVASTIYGRNWQTPLAEDAGVNDRTVRRWAKGDSPVPADIEPLLRQIWQRRIAEVAESFGVVGNRRTSRKKA
jgi:hypothetical protein